MDIRPLDLTSSRAPSRIGGFRRYQGSFALLRLRTTEVHVWSAFLDIAPSSVRVLEQGLSEGERARANRFYYDKDRSRFIVARYVLRSILGRYLETSPARLRFQYGRYGKPFLVEEGCGPALRFNISHSNQMALYAVAKEREIGIDLEHIRPKLASMEVAERFFSPREIAALRALPADHLSAAFFVCWTRKEAYIKARGEGLSHSLDKFDVSLEPGRPTALLRTYDDPREASRWTIQDLFPMAGYAGAIAVQGQGYDISCRQWPTKECFGYFRPGFG